MEIVTLLKSWDWTSIHFLCKFKLSAVSNWCLTSKDMILHKKTCSSNEPGWCADINEKVGQFLIWIYVRQRFIAVGHRSSLCYLNFVVLCRMHIATTKPTDDKNPCVSTTMIRGVSQSCNVSLPLKDTSIQNNILQLTLLIFNSEDNNCSHNIQSTKIHSSGFILKAAQMHHLPSLQFGNWHEKLLSTEVGDWKKCILYLFR